RTVILYSDDEIDRARETGKLASSILDKVGEIVAPGSTTQDIDDLVAKLASEAGVRCAPLNYKGFPKSCCTSVNEVVCHGIPNQYHVLRNGDIINVDITLIGKDG